MSVDWETERKRQKALTEALFWEERAREYERMVSDCYKQAQRYRDLVFYYEKRLE